MVVVVPLMTKLSFGPALFSTLFALCSACTLPRLHFASPTLLVACILLFVPTCRSLVPTQPALSLADDPPQLPPTAPTALHAASHHVALTNRRRTAFRRDRITLHAHVSLARLAPRAMYPTNLRTALAAPLPIHLAVAAKSNPRTALLTPQPLMDAILTPSERAAACEVMISEFVFAIPRARTRPQSAWCCHPNWSAAVDTARRAIRLTSSVAPVLTALHPASVRQSLFFPDKRLLQFDCGKLQELDGLLRRLKGQSDRVLIFTQMSRMLDILEAFLNLHGHTYMRLDGSTKPEQRQALM